jgi:hypothetical protein
MRTWLLRAWIAIVLLGFWGCRAEEKAPVPPEPVISEGRSAISGIVSFDGDVTPAAQAIPMDADPNCARMHPEPALNEPVVVGEGNGLGNTFVYVKEGLAGRTFAPPGDPATLDQRGCLYQPRVVGVRVGQSLRIVNGDETLHNVHAFAKKNKEFNIGQPVKGLSTEKVFDAPEVMIPIRCDVHKWMAAYLGVVEHPFFTVTGSDGRFNFSGLPSGSYVVEAWHEAFGFREATLTLGEGETKAISFSYGSE